MGGGKHMSAKDFAEETLVRNIPDIKRLDFYTEEFLNMIGRIGLEVVSSDKAIHYLRNTIDLNRRECCSLLSALDDIKYTKITARTAYVMYQARVESHDYYYGESFHSGKCVNPEEFGSCYLCSYLNVLDNLGKFIYALKYNGIRLQNKIL